MAELAGCSTATIQSIELGRLPLSEEIGRTIAAETHIHLRWLLENDRNAPIVRSPDGRCSYSKSDYENARALATVGPPDEFMEMLTKDYAASFYGQIRAILSNAVKKEKGELATWRIAKFLEECRVEFGHDKSLIPESEQFGLRGGNSSLADSPYLKHRQVAAGIELFRRYAHERETEVPKALQQLKKLEKAEKARSGSSTARRRKRRAGQRRRPQTASHFSEKAIAPDRNQ